MAEPIDLQTIKAKLQDIYDSGNPTEAYTITMTGVELAITILLLASLRSSWQENRTNWKRRTTHEHKRIYQARLDSGRLC